MNCSNITSNVKIECGSPIGRPKAIFFPYYRRGKKHYCVDEFGNKATLDLTESIAKIEYKR